MALEHKIKGENIKAIETLEFAMLVDAEDVYVKYNLAALYGDIGNFNGASKICKDLIGVGFENYATWLVLARAYLGLGELDNALAAYQRAKIFNPISSELHKEIAQLKWMTSANAEYTLHETQLAIKEHPDNVSLHLIKAEILGYVDKKDMQLSYVKELIKRFPREPQVAFLYSRVCLKSCDFGEALKYAIAIYRMSSNNADVIIHYANCLLACGESLIADSIVYPTLSMFPKNQHLIAIQSTIWRLKGDLRYEQLCDYKTLVSQIELSVPDGWNSLEAYLTDLEAELDEIHQFKTHPFAQSVKNGSQVAFINKSSKKALRAYESAVIGAVESYLTTTQNIMEVGDLRPTVSGAWSVKLFESGHHKNHVHPDGWLSSACHIRFAPAEKKDHQGWLKLGEPGMFTPKYLPAEKLIKPRRGQVVIFPSYMWHGTIPYKQNIERLSIAADINKS